MKCEQTAEPQTAIRKAEVLSEETCIPKPVSMDGFLATPIPLGVFSRRYSLPNSEVACVAYHTPSQSVVFLEGDSAEVWWRIYAANGDCESALQYIRENGTFDNEEEDSRAVLTGFLEDLQHSNLIGERPRLCAS
jgi:hypothetical protein